MDNEKYQVVTVSVDVNTDSETVWKLWTTPEHIQRWNSPSAEWETVSVENDARLGGAFCYRMRLADGTDGFDYTGIYDEVTKPVLITATLAEGRKTKVTFEGSSPVRLTETFEVPADQPAEMHRDFCMQVLNTFKLYAESHSD